jgi:hypothetical protein
MRSYGADLLELRELFEADTVANADQLGWDRHTPGLLVVLAASGGATVALGGYGVAIRAEFKDKPELTTPGPPDPIWLLAQALDDQQAIMDTFRVLVWGYTSEIVASLWPDRWAEALERLAGVMNVASDVEAKVLEISPTMPELSEQDLARQQGEHRTSILAAMAEAASGREIQSDNPWLRVALPAWSGFYAEGQETIAQLMHDMNAHLVDTPDKHEPFQGADDAGPTSPLFAAGMRLYQHIDDVPLGSEFKSILMACLETANVVLTGFQAGRHDAEAEVGPDTEALLEAWQSPAAADRAVRTTTWLILGGAIAPALAGPARGSDRRVGRDAVEPARSCAGSRPLRRVLCLGTKLRHRE